MISTRILLLCAAAATLAGCGGARSTSGLTNPAPCPQASVLFDASRVVELNGEARLANVGYTAEILGVRSLCRYGEDGGPIDSDLEIDFAFGRGAAAQGNSHTYNYFVAVTRRDAAVIEKETFPISANFGNNTIVYDSDRISSIVIPRRDDNVSGENFEIIVGFELTEDQIEFNRSGVRFRATAGELAVPGQ